MKDPEAPERFPPWSTGSGSVCKRPFTSHSQSEAILHSIRRGETHTLENLQLLKAVTLLEHNSKEAPPDNKPLLERKVPYTGKLAYSQIKEPFVPYQNHRLSDETSIWEKIEICLVPLSILNMTGQVVPYTWLLVTIFHIVFSYRASAFLFSC